MTAKKQSLGLKCVSSVQLYVRDLERWRDYYIRRLDFTEVAVSTSDFESQHQARACAVEAGSARFVITSPTGTDGDAARWLHKHPEGVGCVSFEVEDAERAFALLKARGATPTDVIQRRADQDGVVSWFDITTPIGDTLFRFVQRAGRTPILPGLTAPPARAVSDASVTARNRFGVEKIDHITLNFLTLQPA